MVKKNSKFLNLSKKNIFLKKIYFFYNIYIRNFKYLRKSSQFEEDKIILKLFPKNFVGNYVDIGSFHPTKYNNTFLLYKKGWRGVNIDLNPFTIEMFNYFRPQDINICSAISSKSGKEKLFFSGDLSPENTIQKSHKKFLKKFFNYKDNNFYTKIVNTVNINSIFEKYNIKSINFLSIDVEGHEFKILKSINFNKINVEVICVEILEHDKFLKTKSEVLLKFLKKNNYTLKAKTVSNYIFKKNEK